MANEFGLEITDRVDIGHAARGDFILHPDDSMLKLDMSNDELFGTIEVTFKSTPGGSASPGTDNLLYTITHNLGYEPAYIAYYLGQAFEFYGGGSIVEILPANPIFNDTSSSEWTVKSLMTPSLLQFYINHNTSLFNTSIVGEKLVIAWQIYTNKLADT